MANTHTHACAYTIFERWVEYDGYKSQESFVPINVWAYACKLYIYFASHYVQAHSWTLLLFTVAFKALYIFYPHIKVTIFEAHSFFFVFFSFLFSFFVVLLWWWSLLGAGACVLLHNAGCLRILPFCACTHTHLLHYSITHGKVGP